MMKEIETLSFDELAVDNGMDVLWQKLRYELQVTIKGIFQRELLQTDEELAKRSPPVTVGGRQLAWMVRRKFDVDLTEQNVLTEREVHDLVLQKDNVPAYLLTLDSLLMEVKIDDVTLEVVFSKQMESSLQLVDIMKLYNKGCIR